MGREREEREAPLIRFVSGIRLVNKRHGRETERERFVLDRRNA